MFWQHYIVGRHTSLPEPARIPSSILHLDRCFRNLTPVQPGEKSVIYLWSMLHVPRLEILVFRGIATDLDLEGEIARIL